MKDGSLRSALHRMVYDEKWVEDVDTSMEDHCVTGDMRVLTDKGWLKIRDFADKERYVVSHDGKLHRCYYVCMTQKNVEVYTIETYDRRTVTATASHRFMLADGMWKRLDELTEGDELYEVAENDGCKAKQITYAGKADVYNMEVEGTHNYVVNGGFVAHNCYDECRYVLMESLISPSAPREIEVPRFDPLRSEQVHVFRM